MIEKIAFVSFRSTDLAADRRFWGETLGLELAKDFQGQWIEFDTPEGKTIALEQYSPEGTPPTLALETDDLDAEMARLKAAGVPFVGEVIDSGVCRMAFMQSPSGHTIMLHQMAPERKAAASD